MRDIWWVFYINICDNGLRTIIHRNSSKLENENKEQIKWKWGVTFWLERKQKFSNFMHSCF